MKKILSLFIITSSLLVHSCTSLDLDGLAPINSIPADGAITNLNSALAAVNGMYDEMQGDDYDKWLVLAQIYSDEAVFTGTFPTRFEFNNLNVTTNNGTNATVFTSFYDCINVANNIIELIPEVEDPTLTDELKNSFVGEARFIRALNYWHLTEYYGDVPLVLSPTREVGEVLNVPNDPKSKIYEQIINDLLFAQANITNTNTNRATALAAQALLARIYLYQGDWNNALTEAVNVLGQDFDLTQFPYLEDEIFFLGYNTADGNSLAFWYGPEEFGGRQDAAPSAKLLNAFEAGDLRRDLSVDDSQTLSQFIFTTKYNDYGAAGTNTDPVRLIRHAELVLIAAEAAAEQGFFDTANKWYNMVRARAGLPAKTLDASNYVDLILQERFVELSFEGPHRFLDLRRRGRAAQEIPGYQSCNDIWPIPQREIDRNPNLNQNGCCNC